MSYSFASIAAAITAAAANASAGITSSSSNSNFFKFNQNKNNNKKLMCNNTCSHPNSNTNTNCSNSDYNNASSKNETDELFKTLTDNGINNISNSHQIGTNLSELSVCWHKMSSDICEKCGEPFYEANQFKNCSKCSNRISIEELNKKFGHDLNLYDKINPANDLVKNNELLNFSITNDESNKFDFNTIVSKSNNVELTKDSFQQEFSSLIVKSNVSTTNLSFLFEKELTIKLSDQIDIISSSSGSSISSFSSKDLIDQIKLYNKYNQLKLNEIKYEYQQEIDFLKISGLLKIHWNLKNALTILYSNKKKINDYKSSPTTNFTSLKHLNEKKQQQQKSWDDSSLNNINFNSNDAKPEYSSTNTAFSRSQTVKCRSNKKTNERPRLNMVEINETSDISNEDDNNEKFIPSYGCVSSICIDNTSTCLNAIKILFDKFHISNPPEHYSLYKVYQSGDKKELKDDDLPLIQRLWMGPFNEDKIFIMEKGRQLHMNQEIVNLFFLPLPLLYNLVENINQEELKEENLIKNKYKNYLNNLNDRLIYLTNNLNKS